MESQTCCLNEETLGQGLWQVHADGLRVIGWSSIVGDSLEIWIGFRGTSNPIEAIMDSYIEMVPLTLGDSGRHGHVHSGFLRAYQCLRPLLFARLATEVRGKHAQKVSFHVTGHSLGGAMATLCAFQLAAAAGDFELFALLGDTCREVHCVTWGSPKIGDIVFRDNYRSQVPSTARVVNRWDVVPWLPPCGRVEDDFQHSDDAEDDGQGLGYMKSLVMGIVHELGDVTSNQSPEYVHVTDAIQLDMSLFSRFAWAASCIWTAHSCMEQGLEWMKSFANWKDVLKEAVSPHFLSSYETNLDRAYSGFQLFSPENVVTEICCNIDRLGTVFGRLEGCLHGAPFDASIAAMRAGQRSGLSPDLVTAMQNHVSGAPAAASLGTCLAGANLAVSVVGTAGTWYGLWCIHHNLKNFREGTEVMHRDVMQQLESILLELKSLPEKIISHLQVLDIAKNMDMLKSCAKVTGQNLDLLDQCVRGDEAYNFMVADTRNQIAESKRRGTLLQKHLDAILHRCTNSENSHDAFAPVLAGCEGGRFVMFRNCSDFCYIAVTFLKTYILVS